MLVIAVAIVVVGATVLVLTLPPPITIAEGSAHGMLAANFPTTTSLDPAFGNVTATTHATQTSGPSSSLTLVVHSYAFALGYNHEMNYVQIMHDVAVIGRFAPNLRLGTLQFTCRVTGSNSSIDFYNNWTQGPNVSVDHQQTFGFFANGTGSLSATLMNAGGRGPFYTFDYGANGESRMLYQHTQVFEFRATVTGWMLPAISLGVALKIMNVPKTITLYSAGARWYADSSLNWTPLSLATLVPYTVTGAMNATAPVTGYVMNLTEYWDYSNSGTVRSWHWSLNIGTSSTPIALMLPSDDYWLMVYRTGSSGPPGPAVFIYATQDIAATT
ncbi:MAG TPA: hypothetical protein VEY12_08325 [Thermoplasmata archaeon]|nr:hypothetical protein [Thermoplasmata archaeon]